MTIHIIYKTTNLVTAKFYIGKHKQSSLDFDGYLGSGTVIKRAIKKYGRENFIRETLATFTDEQECYLAEKKMLESFWQDENCYNLESGGRGGKIVSDESRKRMSEAARRRSKWNHTDAAKQKISDARKINPSPGMSGKHHSDIVRSRISASNKGQVRSDETRKRMSESAKRRWNKPTITD